jgi:uncharacterized protein (DUF111 family)
MKVLCYDCFSGISGDMNLGAMIDLGVSPHYLCSQLEKLHLPEHCEIRIKKRAKKRYKRNPRGDCCGRR